jgi:uncharacterized membrane protein YciS (DUF1049 family)
MSKACSLIGALVGVFTGLVVAAILNTFFNLSDVILLFFIISSITAICYLVTEVFWLEHRIAEEELESMKQKILDRIDEVTKKEL